MDAARGVAVAAKAGKVETGWFRVWWWRVSHRKEPHTNTEDKTFEVRTTNLFESKNSAKVRLLYQVLYKKGVWGKNRGIRDTGR